MKVKKRMRSVFCSIFLAFCCCFTVTASAREAGPEGLLPVGGALPLLPVQEDATGEVAESVLFQKQTVPPFSLTRVRDYDTDATLGRAYTPADYSASASLLYFGDSVSDCSAATPFQMMITAFSPDNAVFMGYKSHMSYLYPPEKDYNEGQLFFGREMMLYSMSAMDFADYTMIKMAGDGQAINREKSIYKTDEEDPYLREISQYYLDYMNGLPKNFLYNLFDVRCDRVFSTYADETYRFMQNGTIYNARIITLTSQMRFMMYGNAVTGAFYEMQVPYVYMMIAPAELFAQTNPLFELFVSNTRVTDEFRIMTQLRAEELIMALSNGYTIYAELDDEAVQILGSDYGSYDTDAFCDYILDQNDYTTQDGRSFKVPTSYDYVYEGDDGQIYVTSSTEQPAGSTRLYAN